MVEHPKFEGHVTPNEDEYQKSDPLKFTFSVLILSLTVYGPTDRLAVVASQIIEITRNSEKIRTYSTSRSSKVFDLGANRKRICKFLLVINSNNGLPLTVFEILTHNA